MNKMVYNTIVNDLSESRLPHWNTVRETARMLNLSEGYLRRMAKEGKVPYIMVGNRVKLDAHQVSQALMGRYEPEQERDAGPGLLRLAKNKSYTESDDGL